MIGLTVKRNGNNEAEFAIPGIAVAIIHAEDAFHLGEWLVATFGNLPTKSDTGTVKVRVIDQQGVTRVCDYQPHEEKNNG